VVKCDKSETISDEKEGILLSFSYGYHFQEIKRNGNQAGNEIN